MSHPNPIVGLAEFFLLVVIIMAAPTYIAYQEIRAGRSQKHDDLVEEMEDQVNAAIEEAFANGVEYANGMNDFHNLPIHNLD